MRDLFVQPSGQDDNLGDSVLRAGFLTALSHEGIQTHAYLEGQTSDYTAGLPTDGNVRFYRRRDQWLRVSSSASCPAYAVNPGEINPDAGQLYPAVDKAGEMHRVVRRGGVVIAAGIGLRDVQSGGSVRFARVLQKAAIMSWRDQGSRDAAGFGEVNPDWGFALGADAASWLERSQRQHIAVTLRFDRPWPGSSWIEAIRSFARRTGTSIITLAQVSRDAPRAVFLAEELGGEYRAAPSTRHDDVDKHVRAIYGRSLAVVSDRAHALIMGASEGAYPIGTASDPQKIERILAAAGVEALTGVHDAVAARIDRLESELDGLADSVENARERLHTLARRIGEAFPA